MVKGLHALTARVGGRSMNDRSPGSRSVASRPLPDDFDAGEPAGIPSLPVCCDPSAYRLLGRQAGVLESSDGLLAAAAALSLHGCGRGDADALDRSIQAMADTVRGRATSRSADARLAHLHEYLFDELGFRGNAEHYDAPANSFLPSVIETRRGLPIALALVYKLVAERVGLGVRGVGLPGHFLAAVYADGADGPATLVDPFHGGRSLDRDDVRRMVSRSTGHPEADLDDETIDGLLAPVSHLHWFTRMLQNLLHAYNAAGQFGDVAAMLEMQMLLWPDQTQLRRDLALVLARLGLPRPAGAWLDSYLRLHPDDPQRTDLEKLLDVLRV